MVATCRCGGAIILDDLTGPEVNLSPSCVVFLRNVLGVFCVEKMCYETNYESHGTIRTNLSVQSTWTTSHDMQFPTVAAKLHFPVSLSATIET